MPTWLTAFLDWLLGRTAAAQTNEQLGKTEQSNADLLASNNEAQRAKQIDDADNHLTHDELVDSLRGPQGPDNSGR